VTPRRNDVSPTAAKVKRKSRWPKLDFGLDREAEDPRYADRIDGEIDDLNQSRICAGAGAR
jgi:hypothetical protein